MVCYYRHFLFTLLAVLAKATRGQQVDRLSSKNARYNAHNLLWHLQRQAQETNTGWEQVGQQLVGEAAFDRAGWAVAMSADGSRIAVSATKNDSGGIDSGHVRVFDLNDKNQWDLVGTEILGESGSEAGQSIALSLDGTTLAIGSYGISPYTGYVRVYRLSNSVWQKVGEDIVGISDRDRFGASLSFSENGNRLAIGAPYHDGDDQIRGQVRVYELQSFAWKQIGSSIDGEEEGDMSHVVSLNPSGTVLAVGAPRNNGSARNSGSVRVFQKTSTLSEEWVQLGDKINGATDNDQSGTSVALSEDGMVVAIGSPFHSAVAGADDKSGHVRVFTYDTEDNAWTQKGSDIDAESEDDWLGAALALSSGGEVLAAGAPKHNFRGQVRIYQYALGQWNLGDIINGAEDDQNFGADLSLAADGLNLVVGVEGSSANGERSGRAVAFKFMNIVSPGWEIELNDFVTTFGGVEDDVPELSFTYDGERPPDDNEIATYNLTMLTSSCVLGEANDDAITVVNPSGIIPGEDTFSITPKLDIDTSAITTSTYYFSTEGGKGKISFCLKVEIFVGEEMKTFESADVSLDIDQTRGFEVVNFQTNRKPSIVRVSQQAQFNYTLDSFFCDDNGLNIGTDTREVFPGQEVSICLKTPNAEGAEVVDVQSVRFENSFAPLLSIPLIDIDGNPRQDTTVKECGDGKCRIAAETIPELYEYVDRNGNTVDVSQGVYMTGTVIYEFARRLERGSERNLQLSDRVKSKFTMKINLAKPPLRSSAASAVGNSWLAMLGTSAAGGMLAGSVL